MEAVVRRWLRRVDERIVRLHAGRARNLAADRDRQIAELDDAPEPTAELELLAMAIFAPPNGR